MGLRDFTIHAIDRFKPLGVDEVVGNPTLRVLQRAGGLRANAGTEWVTGHVLRHHLRMDKYLYGQDGEWRLGAPPMSRDRTVVIFGLAPRSFSGLYARFQRLRLNDSRIHTDIPWHRWLHRRWPKQMCVAFCNPDTENMFAAAFAQMPQGRSS